MKSDKYESFLKEIENNRENESTFNLNDRVLVVDGLNTFIRAFSVNPAINEDGLHVGGIIGFLKSLRYTLNFIKPSRCIIVFDGKDGSKRRRKIYPQYKETRKIKKRLNRNVDWGTAPQDEEESLKQQIGRLIEYLEHLPLTLISVDGIEADDTMAYISQQLLPESNIILMSTDKDFLQLVDDRVKVWSPTKKKMYTPDSVFEEYGIHSKNMLTYRILDGDKSDNINGIKGAGIKSIIKYCPQITTDRKFDVMDLMDFAKNSDSKIKLLENIKNSSNIIKRNYLLMQLNKVDIPKHTMRKIQGAVNNEIPKLIKFKFQSMFLKDKLWSQIPNLDLWLQDFIDLHKYIGRDK